MNIVITCGITCRLDTYKPVVIVRFGIIPEQPSGGEKQGGGDQPTVGKGYVEPCLQWGADGEKIKKWMKTHTTDFNTTIDLPLSLTFTCYKPYIQISHTLENHDKPGLIMSTISYYEWKDPLTILKNIEKSYNCKISAGPYAENRYVAEDVIINNKKTNTRSSPNSTILSIQFKLDE